MTGANIQVLIDGLGEGGYTNLIGGASGQPWGPLAKTYQYFDGGVMNDSAVALKLTGVKSAIWETTHGVEPPHSTTIRVLAAPSNRRRSPVLVVAIRSRRTTLPLAETSHSSLVRACTSMPQCLMVGLLSRLLPRFAQPEG